MIFIKTVQEIEYMRQAGKVVRNALQMIEPYVKCGVATLELDTILEQYVLSFDTIPSFKGYQGYQHCSCISVNSAVVHGVPNGYKLQLGDIVGVDIAVSYKGYHADAARTFGVEKISGSNQKLIECTRQSFFEGLKYARTGCRLGDIGNSIQSYVESNGYSIVRELSGHGIGKSIHEDPQVPNFGAFGKGTKLKSGMALAIEPMVNMGTRFVEIDWLDKWTCRTQDGNNSAHYENTVVITDGAPEILTL
ncbi:MAG: type I methionyl aminopeptidase [Clostridiales bacterium]|jgi:methionyl aminopeptidase|nr:type I methionyl aminopeptidase [Clostridiales bacterium]